MEKFRRPARVYIYNLRRVELQLTEKFLLPHLERANLHKQNGGVVQFTMTSRRLPYPSTTTTPQWKQTELKTQTLDDPFHILRRNFPRRVSSAYN